MFLPSGGNLRQAIDSLPPGEPLELMPGGQYAGVTCYGHPGPLHIEGHGASITGGLKIEDCGGPLTLEDLLLPDSPSHGLMLVQCHEVLLHRVHVLRAQVNGILTARVYDIRAVECQARESRTGHGLYYSEAGGGYIVEGGIYTANHRCSIQVNAHPARAQGLRITGADCRNPGNASIQCAAIAGGVLSGNLVGGGRQEIVLWDDTGGKSFACRDFDCTGQDGSYVVSRNCRNIRLPKGARPTRPG